MPIRSVLPTPEDYKIADEFISDGPGNFRAWLATLVASVREDAKADVIEEMFPTRDQR